jgi:hypothetical protein
MQRQASPMDFSPENVFIYRAFYFKTKIMTGEAWHP